MTMDWDKQRKQQWVLPASERTLREPLLSPMLRNFVLVPEISCREDNLYHGDQQMPQTRAISPGKRAVKHLSAHHWKEGLTAGQEKNVH